MPFFGRNKKEQERLGGRGRDSELQKERDRQTERERTSERERVRGEESVQRTYKAHKYVIHRIENL